MSPLKVGDPITVVGLRHALWHATVQTADVVIVEGTLPFFKVMVPTQNIWWLEYADEGVKWIRGHAASTTPAARALLVAFALTHP